MAARRLSLLLGVLAAGLALSGALAQTIPPGLIYRLNGTPTNEVRVTATAPAVGTLTLTAGAPVVVQCDVAVDISVSQTPDGGVGMRLIAGALFRAVLPPNDDTVTFLALSGAALCKGWTLQ